ncbi:hypothetical protein Tco_0158771 [Tanacetum coccineum]
MTRRHEESTRECGIYTRSTLRRSTKVSQSRIATLAIRICKKNASKPELSSQHSQMNISLPLTSMLMLNLCLYYKGRFGGMMQKEDYKSTLRENHSMKILMLQAQDLWDSIFNRLQSLLVLGILGVDTPPEDLNVKFLRRLPSE